MLNQNDRNLTGFLPINYPAAGSVLVPLAVGAIGDDGSITLTGQAQLALGSIDVSFTGKHQANRIGGSAILVLDLPWPDPANRTRSYG